MFSLTKPRRVVWANWLVRGHYREPVPYLHSTNPLSSSPSSLSQPGFRLRLVKHMVMPVPKTKRVSEAVAGLVLLLRHGTSDFGPDMSFDTSAFPGYVSGLGVLV
ncbi:hypothetical protein Tco_0564969 [Tanacetum coccineum]